MNISLAELSRQKIQSHLDAIKAELERKRTRVGVVRDAFAAIMDEAEKAISQR